MRLDIRYRMRFHYPEPVWEAQNEVRVRPRDDDRQRVISYRLTPFPSARVLSFTDYWGTTVNHVGVREPHEEFEIIAEAAVETLVKPFEEDDSDIQTHQGDFYTDFSTHEYLVESPHTVWNDQILHTATSTIEGIKSVTGQINAIVNKVAETLEYKTGSTDIGIALSDLMVKGQGVCQDFAHLSIAMLRCVDIPARYVSGYLFAADETSMDEAVNEIVSVQTHAWIEAAIPGKGWLPVDPTNRQPVGERHVTIGHGRDYDDVAPVRGVFMGPNTPKVEAEVVMARMAPTIRAVVAHPPRRLRSRHRAYEKVNLDQQQQQQQQ